MFVRLVYESFRRQKRRKVLAGAAITLGVTVATAMIAVATDIGDKINRELRTIGANLIVTPQEDSLDLEIGGVNLKPPTDGAFLNEADLPKIKGIFWHNNITGFAPMLPVNVAIENDGKRQDVTLLGTYFSKPLTYGRDEFSTGVRSTHPWWKVSGAWPADSSSDVLLGERLAARLDEKSGNNVTVAGRRLRVSGVLSTGGVEDDEIVAPLALAQEFMGRPAAVRRVYVSALTKPEDAFGRRDPKSLSGAIYDRWYCTPYPQSIAFQLSEAIPHSHAEQIRQVSQNEGAVLTRIEGLIFLITVAALFASALAVSAGLVVLTGPVVLGGRAVSEAPKASALLAVRRLDRQGLAGDGVTTRAANVAPGQAAACSASPARFSRWYFPCERSRRFGLRATPRGGHAAGTTFAAPLAVRPPGFSTEASGSTRRSSAS